MNTSSTKTSNRKKSKSNERGDCVTAFADSNQTQRAKQAAMAIKASRTAVLLLVALLSAAALLPPPVQAGWVKVLDNKPYVYVIKQLVQCNNCIQRSTVDRQV